MKLLFQLVSFPPRFSRHRKTLGRTHDAGRLAAAADSGQRTDGSLPRGKQRTDNYHRRQKKDTHGYKTKQGKKGII